MRKVVAILGVVLLLANVSWFYSDLGNYQSNLVAIEGAGRGFGNVSTSDSSLAKTRASLAKDSFNADKTRFYITSGLIVVLTAIGYFSIKQKPST